MSWLLLVCSNGGYWTRIRKSLGSQQGQMWEGYNLVRSILLCENFLYTFVIITDVGALAFLVQLRQEAARFKSFCITLQLADAPLVSNCFKQVLKYILYIGLVSHWIRFYSILFVFPFDVVFGFDVVLIFLVSSFLMSSSFLMLSLFLR